MSRKQNTEAGPEKIESDSDDRLDTAEENEVSQAQESDEETRSDGDAETIVQLSEEERLNQRVDELEEKLLRSAAEFDNYKKRTARRFEEIIASANDAIIMSLLELVDNFERALEHAGENSGNNDALMKGTELIYNLLSEILRKHEVTPIEAVGRPFDPDLHEALMPVESEEYEEGMIAVEITKGYRKGSRVLRHSKVGVSSGSKKANQEE